MVTVWIGAGFVVLGVVSYVGSGAESLTALIPAVFGVVLGALGLAGRRQDRRALAMHVAAGVAVLGFLGSARGLASLADLLAGRDVDRPWAVGDGGGPRRLHRPDCPLLQCRPQG
jgi:hypothetical protein